MNITFVSPVATVGGAERVLLTWVAALRRAATPVRLSAILLADGPLRDRLAGFGVDVHVLSLPGSLATAGDTALRGRSAGSGIRGLLGKLPAAARFVFRLRHEFTRLAPDLIHSNGLKAHLLTALAKPAGTPLVWHLHDFYSERPVAKWGLKFARLAATGGVAISDAVRRDTRRLLPGFPVRTVLNAVDTDHFSPEFGERADLDRLSGLPAAPVGLPRVGLVATYANWKGHGPFLDALAAVPATRPFRGYVVGGPLYSTAGSQVTRAELERKIAANGLVGRVGLVPFQDDPAAVYRALDVVVHASTRPEPFGLTIAEAMSCGRAVVVSAAGGATELFREGESGLGHPPGDVRALAAAVTRLLSDAALRARLGAAARPTAVARFGVTRLSAEIDTLYRGLCGGG